MMDFSNSKPRAHAISDSGFCQNSLNLIQVPRIAPPLDVID